MRSRKLELFSAITLLAVLGDPAHIFAQKDKSKDQIITFDVPGEYGGIYPFGINPKGEVTGSYFTSDGARGFIRNPPCQHL